MSAVKKVLVVGGGIGGQSVAIALAKNGVEVEIAERLDAFNVYGVGIIQQSNALRALDRIGLADKTMEEGFPYGQLKMYTAGGHFIGLAGAPPVEKYPSHNGISRRTLHEIMYAEAIKMGVTYKMGTTVTEIENSENEVTVTFTDNTKSTYDILVASDGINSDMRSLIFGEFKPRYMGVSVWRYPFKKHEDLDTSYMYYGKRSKIGFVPMCEKTMYMFLVSAEGAHNPWIEKSAYIPMLKNYLSEFPVKIAQDAREQITDPDLVNYRPIEASHLPDPWFKNRAIVIGDGAHATVPQLGSGAALALEDGVVLAEELKNANTVEEAFNAFMKKRYERCMAIVNASETLAEWELLEFEGKSLPEGASIGQVVGKAVGTLMAPF
ncbi:FAD-dependent monooxygenase [Pseudozobellia sp. WGM2]|uniref:FAD-dependent monooxygenase n=1 Tax=Pseudozobellia sp. WGM2 TaxID=2787625 RepID=UPI001ADF2F4D|nr:FAD-dependent monooxygenase [Pseudozobellia sp. WGM2]